MLLSSLRRGYERGGPRLRADRRFGDVTGSPSRRSPLATRSTDVRCGSGRASLLEKGVLPMRDYFAEQGPLATSAPVCPIHKSLRGQTALITGANSGIGRAIAVALGAAGANVVVNYVAREDAARETLDEVRSCGAR